MALNKRDLLLAFLCAKGKTGKENEEIVGSVKLMKQIFLVQQEVEFEDNYKFVPYDLGPVSFEIYEELKKLETDGLVIEKNAGRRASYKLSDSGVAKAMHIIKNNISRDNAIALERIKSDFNADNVSKIIRFVYSKYPAFTTKSIIKNIN